jgi:hypothetical protein
MLDNKGQLRTVEAFLAILLLFSALTIATLISPASDSDGNELLADLGMQALVAADREGGLGRLVEKGNWTLLGEAMDALLPVGTAYNLTVYDQIMQSLNDVPISNGMLPSQEVVAVQYPCVSPGPHVNYYLLRLQLAKAR